MDQEIIRRLKKVTLTVEEEDLTRVEEEDVCQGGMIVKIAVSSDCSRTRTFLSES